jgi:hypothetical protein
MTRIKRRGSGWEKQGLGNRLYPFARYPCLLFAPVNDAGCTGQKQSPIFGMDACSATYIGCLASVIEVALQPSHLSQRHNPLLVREAEYQHSQERETHASTSSLRVTSSKQWICDTNSHSRILILFSLQTMTVLWPITFTVEV